MLSAGVEEGLTREEVNIIRGALNIANSDIINQLTQQQRYRSNGHDTQNCEGYDDTDKQGLRA
jgi:hypothetical protein